MTFKQSIKHPIKRPKKPLAPTPRHDFVRREDADGSAADRKCVECGHDERNPVHR